ncbi:DUF2225 domain-containing protein [Anaerobranca gottschalkii]|uniref:DUF2225 domain-containing protein n=1 Tax=Anaerobranca gottschalkii DSM 13577 TaxID=1120990 RepID=A0A1I0BHH1_9FIRM|nr:DUF2225 domain-containing protein [Anaerobranca gottschalkii]SET06260.1 hypothetical protein SAMN03080614_10403 [Anaerobranca gottschalkii DSM 13577]
MVASLYSIKVNCLNCNNQFDTLKPRSKFCIVLNKDTDFCNHYKDYINPYFYEVYVCPQCGFAFTESFTEKLKEDVKREFYEKVASKWYKRYQYSFARSLGTAIEAYKLALLTANIVKEKDWVIAGLALRLGWFYRYRKNLEDEIKFLTIARDYYLKAYNEDGLRGYENPEITVLYLIGELSARIGDNQTALKFLAKVTEHESREFHKAIVNQARDRWYSIKELKRAK